MCVVVVSVDREDECAGRALRAFASCCWVTLKNRLLGLEVGVFPRVGLRLCVVFCFVVAAAVIVVVCGECGGSARSGCGCGCRVRDELSCLCFAASFDVFIGADEPKQMKRRTDCMHAAFLQAPSKSPRALIIVRIRIPHSPAPAPFSGPLARPPSTVQSDRGRASPGTGASRSTGRSRGVPERHGIPAAGNSRAVAASRARWCAWVSPIRTTTQSRPEIHINKQAPLSAAAASHGLAPVNARTFSCRPRNSESFSARAFTTASLSENST